MAYKHSYKNALDYFKRKNPTFLGALTNVADAMITISSLGWKPSKEYLKTPIGKMPISFTLGNGTKIPLTYTENSRIAVARVVDTVMQNAEHRDNLFELYPALKTEYDENGKRKTIEQLKDEQHDALRELGQQGENKENIVTTTGDITTKEKAMKQNYSDVMDTQKQIVESEREQ